MTAPRVRKAKNGTYEPVLFMIRRSRHFGQYPAVSRTWMYRGRDSTWLGATAGSGSDAAATRPAFSATRSLHLRLSRLRLRTSADARVMLGASCANEKGPPGEASRPRILRQKCSANCQRETAVRIVASSRPAPNARKIIVKASNTNTPQCRGNRLRSF
jgi:hypothetical protein